MCFSSCLVVVVAIGIHSVCISHTFTHDIDDVHNHSLIRPDCGFLNFMLSHSRFVFFVCVFVVVCFMFGLPGGAHVAPFLLPLSCVNVFSHTHFASFVRSLNRILLNCMNFSSENP